MSTPPIMNMHISYHSNRVTWTRSAMVTQTVLPLDKHWHKFLFGTQMFHSGNYISSSSPHIMTEFRQHFITAEWWSSNGLCLKCDWRPSPSNFISVFFKTVSRDQHTLLVSVGYRPVNLPFPDPDWALHPLRVYWSAVLLYIFIIPIINAHNNLTNDSWKSWIFTHKTIDLLLSAPIITIMYYTNYYVFVI